MNEKSTIKALRIGTDYIICKTKQKAHKENGLNTKVHKENDLKEKKETVLCHDNVEIIKFTNTEK